MYQLDLPFSITSEPALIPEITGLLASGFGPDIAPALLDADFLDWKYFRDRPGWRGSRSFVAEQDGAAVAHACIWPIAFHTPGGVVNSVHLLDWVAQPGAPGAGVALYRGLIEMSDTALVIGGSQQARKLLPKLGFRSYGQMRYFARVIRPLAQFRMRPKPSLSREAARLVRNVVWAVPPLPEPVPDWSAELQNQAGEWLDDLVREPALALGSPGVRSSFLVNYLLDCPVAHCHLYKVASGLHTVGYFILNEVSGETRIIDLFVRSASLLAWEVAFRLALRTASELPGTCEVVAASSLDWIDGVLQRCGMRKRTVRPVFLYDPRCLLAGARPLHLQMTDSDAFLLYSPAYPFLT